MALKTSGIHITATTRCTDMAARPGGHRVSFLDVLHDAKGVLYCSDRSLREGVVKRDTVGSQGGGDRDRMGGFASGTEASASSRLTYCSI
jgi:hypothetical protein